MKAMRSGWLSVMMSGLGFIVASQASGAGKFSLSEPLGNGNLDASIGLNAAKTYTHAYNIRGGDVSINGVLFTGVENFTGVEGAFGMSGWSSIASGGSTIGSGSGLDALLASFNYNNWENVLSLSNLVAGQTYVLTFYNKTWGPPNYDRVLSVTSASGAAITFDENMGGEPNAHLLRYTFTAAGDSEWVKFNTLSTGTMHLYGFSTEQVFNNAWGSGADWTTATWGAPGVPNAAGAGADFAAQGAPTAINLDAPVTVGHLRLDGANAWTVSGANTLTLQADVGGVSVLSTPSGSHTVSAAVALNNGVMKTGSGTLTLAGAVSGAGSVTVDAGTLEITAANTLPTDTSVEIASGAFLRLSNASAQTVAALTFGGALQHSGTWGAEGSGAQFTSPRLTGTGLLQVLAGPAVGTFTASGSLGGGDLDASVGLDSGATYFAAVNVNGGALTINGVAFAGSAGGNPAGPTYTTDNFGNVNVTPQGTVTGNLGLLLNDFNYGSGGSPQTLILRNLIAGRTYVLTFYNRVWAANDNRTQNVTTTSGATTAFNPDAGEANTANWLRYTFIASGSSEAITMNSANPTLGSFHLYGFSVSMGPAGAYTDVTRRDSGTKVIADNRLSDVRIVEGTGTPGNITLGAAVTAVNSLTQSAADDVATVSPASRTLALNSILQEAGAGGLTLGEGVLKSLGTSLLVDNASPNPVTLNSVIWNGTGASLLSKAGAGTLTLAAVNLYTGGTSVNGGTLRVTGNGTVGTGPLDVNGGTLQIDGGSVYPNWGNAWNVGIANATVNQTAGWLGYGGYIRVGDSMLNLSGGTSGVGLENLLGWGGANTTVNISGSHAADWFVTRFEGGTVNLNLLSGGTLYTDQLFSRWAAGTVRFDGGKLGMSNRDPNRTPGNWIFVDGGGSLTLFVENGGAVIDTAFGNATINRPFLRDGASTGGLTKTGGNTLTLTAANTDYLSTYTGDTQIQGGTLKLTPVPVTVVLVNPGFEQPALGAAGAYLYLGVSNGGPGNDGVTGGWSVIGGGGVSRSGGSPWFYNAPQGQQIAYLQGSVTFTQSINLPVAGAYRLSFSASNRPNYNADNLAVLLDGVTMGSWDYTTINNGGAFKSYLVDLGVLSAGPHELRFEGTSPGGDTATTIDDVQVTRMSGLLPGSLPETTHVAISAGATLDLNDANQALAGLSGGGRVVNSAPTDVTLTVGGGDASTSFGGNIEGGITLAKVGGGTLTLASAANTYSGETLVQGGTLQLPPIGAAATVPNPSFETHDPLQFGSWAYSPSGAEWAFSAAGIAAPGSPWVNGSAAIDGAYAGFIQNAGTITGTITVPAAGTYRLAFLAGKRPGMPATDLYIDIDGVNKLLFAESVLGDEIGTSFGGDLSLSSGTHTLTFRGVTTTGDNDIWIDRIALTSLGGSLPADAVIAVSSGAVLDLNGNAQTLAGLSGSGLVTNGTLAVSGTIAPGGVNAVGTLTLAASAALSGTLLIDVAADGTGDLLQVQGNLDITGLSLQIQDVDQMRAGSQYLIATFAPGGLTGRFASTNLGGKRTVVYNNVAGEIRLVGSGLMFMLK